MLTQLHYFLFLFLLLLPVLCSLIFLSLLFFLVLLVSFFVDEEFELYFPPVQQPLVVLDVFVILVKVQLFCFVYIDTVNFLSSSE